MEDERDAREWICTLDAQMIRIADDFLERRIEPEPFCIEFTQAWIKRRDQRLSKRDTWPERYDLALDDELRRGAISYEEFSAKWRELWGPDTPFAETAAKIHSACAAYDPEPESKYWIDEAELRRFVQQEMDLYRKSVG